MKGLKYKSLILKAVKAITDLGERGDLFEHLP